jgi:hypothetical protein
MTRKLSDILTDAWAHAVRHNNISAGDPRKAEARAALEAVALEAEAAMPSLPADAATARKAVLKRLHGLMDQYRREAADVRAHVERDPNLKRLRVRLEDAEKKAALYAAGIDAAVSTDDAGWWIDAAAAAPGSESSIAEALSTGKASYIPGVGGMRRGPRRMA